MQASRVRSNINPAFKAALLAAVAFLVALALNPAQAFAEVKKADIIFGKTVEERNLTVANCPSIDAKYAILVDANGTVLFERGADDKSQIASITKVMTAIVALDNANDNTYIVVSDNAATVGESSAMLEKGDTLDLDAALKALLVPSGNDAAIAIAETVGAQMIAKNPSLGTDAITVFVNAMNEKAKTLGCQDTIYENPHGLDDGEYAGELHSTARDQAKVAQCAMTYDKIRSIVGGGSTTITVKRDGENAEVELETTDGLLEMYEPTIGIKTGVTDLAGPSFMGAASKDGKELYAIVLGSSDETQRFRDARALFEWGYQHISEFKFANSSEWTQINAKNLSGNVPVIAKVCLVDWPDKTVKATMSNPDAAINLFDLDGNVSQEVEMYELHGNVNAGDKVGEITFMQHNNQIAKQDLIACETIEAPNPMESLGIAWERFIGGFSGKAEKAESKVMNVLPIVKNNKSNAGA